MSQFHAGLIFFTLGASGTGLLVTGMVRKRAKISRWIQTTGTVVGHNATEEKDRDTNRVSTLYAPMVEFTDGDGRVRTYESGTYSKAGSTKLGATVKIAFDPLNPEESTIHTFGEMYAAYLVGCVFTVIATAIGVGFLLQPR